MKFELCQGDCEVWLHQLRDEPIACIFADVPDNIGLSYEAYDDNLSYTEYITKMETWLDLFISKASTVWLSFNARWTVEIGWICARLKMKWAGAGLKIKPCVQTFSFYQHCETDLGNAHRPLWRFQRADASLYPEQIKIPSWRQQHGDSRAKAGGKVPGDTFDFTKLPEKQRRAWHERAIQCGKWVVDFLVPDDHFDFTRVVGNSKQRRKWHPTQLNEGLVERCIRLTTKPGEWVVDPFGGTGTTMRVARRIGRASTLIELDPGYCQEIAKEHGMERRANGKFSQWILEEPDATQEE